MRHTRGKYSLPQSYDEKIDGQVQEMINNHKSVKCPPGSKLTTKMKLELMEFVARWSTLDEINQFFVPTYGITIGWYLIYYYKRSKTWKPVIAKLREKYLQGADEVAIAHKRVRLERREKIYQRAEKVGDGQLALSAIRDTEEAMGGMGKRGGVSLTFNQFNSLSDDEIEQRRLEVLNRIRNMDAIEIKEVRSEITESGQPGVDSNGSSPEARPPE